MNCDVRKKCLQLLTYNRTPSKTMHAYIVTLYLLPTGSEERGVLGGGSIPVAIHTSF